MKRNLKRSLAVSLLSLMPLLAFAEPQHHHQGDIELFTRRDEFVSLRSQETVQLPQHSRGGASSSLVATVPETFFIANWTGANVFPGYSLYGTPTWLPPYPLTSNPPPNITGYFRMNLPPLTPVSQYYYYTNNEADPANPVAKTCVWQLVVSVSGGICSATLYTTTYGIATCAIDARNSHIEIDTCETQVTTIIQ
jgi:hypothetical protein